MTKTQKLDALFDRWQEKFPEQRDRFHKDGIICESKFEEQHPKLLFIAKEPNKPDQLGGDYRVWWKEGVNYTFSHRICDWAYGIQHDFPPLQEIPSDPTERVEVLRSVAFMNLKKTGGTSTADHAAIISSIKNEHSLLLEEISIIGPDIIIGGFRGAGYWSLLFEKTKFIDSGFDIKVARHGSIKMIDYHHPSSRAPRSMSYSLLGRVVMSKVFKNL